MRKDATRHTLKHSEKSSGWFQFLKDDIPLIGNVHYYIVILFNISDRDVLPRLWCKPWMTMIISSSILYHSLLCDIKHLSSKVAGVAGLQRHFIGSTLQMTF